MPNPSRKRRPRDTNQRAKLIVDIAAGEVTDDPDDGKDPKAIARGRLGGQKGGKVRASRLSPEQRTEIARLAAQARWKKSGG